MMSICNLLECSNNWAKTFAILYQYTGNESLNLTFMNWINQSNLECSEYVSLNSDITQALMLILEKIKQ